MTRGQKIEAIESMRVGYTIDQLSKKFNLSKEELIRNLAKH